MRSRIALAAPVIPDSVPAPARARQVRYPPPHPLGPVAGIHTRALALSQGFFLRNLALRPCHVMTEARLAAGCCQASPAVAHATIRYQPRVTFTPHSAVPPGPAPRALLASSLISLASRSCYECAAAVPSMCMPHVIAQHAEIRPARPMRAQHSAVSPSAHCARGQAVRPGSFMRRLTCHAERSGSGQL